MVLGHRNETDWLTPSLALTVWAAHFILLWAASSALPGQAAARWIAGLLTMLALLAIARLWRRGEARSLRSIPGLGMGIATLGIVFNLLPAIVG